MIVGVAQTSRNQGLHQLGEVAERLNTAVFKCLPLALTSPRKSHLRVVSGATVIHLKIHPSRLPGLRRHEEHRHTLNIPVLFIGESAK